MSWSDCTLQHHDVDEDVDGDVDDNVVANIDGNVEEDVETDLDDGVPEAAGGSLEHHQVGRLRLLGLAGRLLHDQHLQQHHDQGR